MMSFANDFHVMQWRITMIGEPLYERLVKSLIFSHTSFCFLQYIPIFWTQGEGIWTIITNSVNGSNDEIFYPIIVTSRNHMTLAMWRHLRRFFFTRKLLYSRYSVVEYQPLSAGYYHTACDVFSCDCMQMIPIDPSESAFGLVCGKGDAWGMFILVKLFPGNLLAYSW